jgi:hypothetical protein
MQLQTKRLVLNDIKDLFNTFRNFSSKPSHLSLHTPQFQIQSCLQLKANPNKIKLNLKKFQKMNYILDDFQTLHDF